LVSVYSSAFHILSSPYWENTVFVSEFYIPNPPPPLEYNSPTKACYTSRCPIKEIYYHKQDAEIKFFYRFEKKKLLMEIKGTFMTMYKASQWLYRFKDDQEFLDNQQEGLKQDSRGLLQGYILQYSPQNLEKHKKAVKVAQHWLIFQLSTFQIQA
jgi:hypothetical protein